MMQDSGCCQPKRLALGFWLFTQNFQNSESSLRTLALTPSAKAYGVGLSFSIGAETVPPSFDKWGYGGQVDWQAIHSYLNDFTGSVTAVF